MQHDPGGAERGEPGAGHEEVRVGAGVRDAEIEVLLGGAAQGAEALDEADLPMPDAVVSIATDTLRPFTPSRLGDRAAAEGRTLIALRLNPPTLARSEYPARPLSDALRAVQSLTEALVQEQSGNVTIRGPLSSQVVEDAELAVLELEAASFVAILVYVS